MEWIFTNLKKEDNKFFFNIDDKENFFIFRNGIKLLIDGYILPRVEYFDEYKNLNQHELIENLYIKHNDNFIKYIKGVFNIILIKENSFQIFNDRHSIKKFFIYQDDDVWIIANNLSLISKKKKLEVNKINAALFCLMEHFIDGTTLFKAVSYSKAATKLIFDKELKKEYYWSSQELIDLQKKDYSYCFLSEYWKNLIKYYIQYLQPKAITMTLTGGNDSRMILAALLNLGEKISAFTFGNPLSYDGVISQLIADRTGIAYDNYFVEHPTADWFSKQALELNKMGNSLINIHRAHRNDALANVYCKYPNTEMIFSGLVGGEYIKEPKYNDKTIPIIFKELHSITDKKTAEKLLKIKLKTKGFNINVLDISKLYSKLRSFLKYGDGLEDKKKKFIYTYLYYGCTHHGQDSTIFSHYIKHIVNPFMDIDFLELIVKSNKWYIHNKFNPMQRLFHSIFNLEITDLLAPELSNIPYAKRGKYTVDDLLRHKLKYIIKRLSYFVVKDKGSYPANFPIGPWLYKFCKEKIPKIPQEVKSLYNVKYIEQQLELIENKTNEENWHIVTNLINLGLIFEYYGKV